MDQTPQLKAFLKPSLVILSLLMLASKAGAQSPVKLVPVAQGLDHPDTLASAGDGSNRLFVLEQPGRIIILRHGTADKTPFLDIRDRVSYGGELGLLGIAFHPHFKENHRFFIDYTVRKGRKIQTIIAEYASSSLHPDSAGREEKILLRIDQPFPNHKGGQLAFGPDGFLYIGMGDGGSGGDPLKNAQNPKVLLGKILRIDVNHEAPYAVPPSNPFSHGPGAPEIWAIGMRNPWRFSFDRKTGRLFCADVGQDKYEEIDLIEGGKNYGWNIMEGLHCFLPDEQKCHEKGLTLPIYEYNHSEGNCIIGGYVYRGKNIPVLDGTYLFGDYGFRTLWGLEEAPGNQWKRITLGESPEPISSFGEDESGEIYVVGYWGTIFKFVPS